MGQKYGGKWKREKGKKWAVFGMRWTVGGNFQLLQYRKEGFLEIYTLTNMILN
jgi:hypothetical protein